MKYQLQRNFIFTLFITAIWHSIFAQNVTITPTGVTPAPLAVDIPKLTFDQIQALPSPQLGDLVTDISFKCMRFYNGEKWVRIMTNKEVEFRESRVFGFGSNGYDQGKFIKAVGGYIYIAGYYTENITFGSTTLPKSSNTGSDVFIVKMNIETGSVVFAHSIPKNGGIHNLIDLEIDNNENCYLLGKGQGITGPTFGNVSLGNSWLVKLNSTGVYNWSKSISSGIEFKGIDINSTGSVVLASQIYGNTTFEGLNFLANSNAEDLLLLSFSSAGSLQWYKQTSGSGEFHPQDIEIDKLDNVIIYGSLFGTKSFDSFTPTDARVIAKYLPSTNSWAWVYSMGLGGIFAPAKLKTSNGKIYIAGELTGTLNLGPYSTTALATDILIVSFSNLSNNTTPSVIWSQRIGGPGNERFGGFDVDASENIFLCGNFQGVNFYFNQKNIPNKGGGNLDFFVAKLDSLGSEVWIQTAEERDPYGNYFFYDMNIDNLGNIYCIGEFDSNLSFRNKLTSLNGSQDVLLLHIID
jgi:hypothetical protein